MKTIKEMVKDNQKVFFQFFREGKLYYKTECGFLFPVPVEDTGNASFFAEDKAILFMRYIRKEMDMINKALEDSKASC